MLCSLNTLSSHVPKHNVVYITNFVFKKTKKLTNVLLGIKVTTRNKTEQHFAEVCGYISKCIL